MKNDVLILRELAHNYHALANQPSKKEKIKLHTAVNDLKAVRPVVLIDELPWSELNFDDQLTLKCVNPVFRKYEDMFRKTLYRHQYFPADSIVRPFVAVSKKINHSSIGIEVEENTVSTRQENHIISHEYHDCIQSEADLEKLKNIVVTYDEKETMQEFELIANAIGDILPVEIKGIDYVYASNWDLISRYRGVTNLLIDLAERPEFMHKTVSKMTDIFLNKMEQYEALGLLDTPPIQLHCTCADTSDLPGKDFDGKNIKLKHIWGRGMAQIFSSVSKDMHDEFDIVYMKKILEKCGLAYYGCCEPLDKKIDIVEKIKNLRKISITPWADVTGSAEIIGKKYVLASKPNPSSVAVNHIDEQALRKEISVILDAVKRNNCSCDIVLKDISTCNHNPENIFKWEKIVMELVETAYN